MVFWTIKIYLRRNTNQILLGVLFLQISFTTASAALGNQQSEYISYADKIALPPGFQSRTIEQKRAWVQSKLKTKPSDSYPYYRLSAFLEDRVRNLEEVYKICAHKAPPLLDDLEYREVCIRSSRNYISVELYKLKNYEIFQQSKRLENREVAVKSLTNIAWAESQEGLFHDAFSRFHEIFRLIPKDNIKLKIRTNTVIATIYIVNGGKDFILRAIKMLKDVIRDCKLLISNEKMKQTELHASYIFAHYNIGIAYLLHLHEYEKAIPFFKVAAGKGSFIKADANTFLALSAVYAKKYDMAEKILQKSMAFSARDGIRDAYLSCYRKIIKVQLGHEAELSSCLSLDNNTTLEVLLDIHKRLFDIAQFDHKQDLYKSFVDLFRTKIEPEYKKRASTSASSTEIMRLEIEAKNKDDKIALGHKIKVFLYVLLVISALLVVMLVLLLRSIVVIKEQKNKATSRKTRLLSILSSIDEGIIIIGHDLEIASIASKFTLELLDTEPNCLSLQELLEKLGLKGDNLARNIEVLRLMLGQDQLTWDINSISLEKASQVSEKTIHFHWSPTFEQGLLKEIVLSIRDVTEVLMLQRDYQNKVEHLALIKSGAMGRHFIADTEKLLASLSQADYANLRTDLKDIHTLKGEARVMELNNIRDNLHLLEQKIIDKDIEKVSQVVNNLVDNIAHMKQMLEINQPDSYLPPFEQFRQRLEVIFQNARQRLNEYKIELLYSLNFEDIKLSSKESRLLQTIVLHSTTNSVDHGFLVENFLSDQAIIKVELKSKNKCNILLLEDNGVGIDWNFIKERSHGLGLPTATRSQLAINLFSGGFSSVSKTTTTSGRGIGMASLVHVVEQLKGRIVLTSSKQGKGTLIKVMWESARENSLIADSAS